MDQVLQSLLEKVGVEKIEELEEYEQAYFNSLAQKFEVEPVSIEGMKDFLKIEIDKITNILANFENSATKDLYYKGCLRNFKILLQFITAPDVKRAMAEREAERVLKNTNASGKPII